MHYHRWQRHGDPLAGADRPKPASPGVLRLASLFWRKVSVDSLDGCWLWTGYTDKDGYGVFTARNVRTRGSMAWRAHRFAYEQHVGPIPEGLHLDHLCRVRNCVNPAHLEPVTSRENVVVRGRGLSAMAARATHCKNGHPWDEANTHISPKGHRECRACGREKKMRRRTAQKREREALESRSLAS